MKNESIDSKQPTVRDVAMLDVPSEIRITPGGSRVVIQVRLNWHENQYENRCYVYDHTARAARPLTRTGDVQQMAWVDNVANAHTPMLIQHGTEDRCVPLSNAMELYRAMQEMDVPVELFIFPSMAHPITKPRKNHAVMSQNLAWFSHYLLGEELQLE